MIPTYIGIAASAKHLRDHFLGGIATFEHACHQRPAHCRAHPETTALLTNLDPAVELVPDPQIARWNLYFGPRPEDGR